MLSGEGKEQKEKGRGEGRGLAVSIGRGPSGAAVARPPNFPYARNGTNTRSSIFRRRLCCPPLGLKSIPDDFFPFFRIVSPLLTESPCGMHQANMSLSLALFDASLTFLVPFLFSFPFGGRTLFLAFSPPPGE